MPKELLHFSLEGRKAKDHRSEALHGHVSPHTAVPEAQK
jgi:hypothetical protein